jgi:uncharacterized OsmC-like protein
MGERSRVKDTEGEGWVVSRIGRAGFRTEIEAGTHRLVADEPVAAGGSDQGPTPYGLLLAALASCTAMTLRMYADRKRWPLESVEVFLREGRSYERDCEDCASTAVGVAHIDRRIELAGALSVEQRTRLLQIADRCPVKQTLERGISVESFAG